MPTLIVNGQPHAVDIDPRTPLLWVLRDHLGLTGTKFGCGAGSCGACAVHVDGHPRRSCQITLREAAGAAITTIEGLGASPTGLRVQRAWLEEDVSQCGYCQAGMIMAAVALLVERRAPTDADVDDTLAGQLCRCGTYQRVRRAIHRASAEAAR
ncbi:MAG: (2Fe-2S)-binding protein [Vicinamibacterales bacterium]